ncbi:aspartyl-phosphate phosphatase Spo0E family protein [Jeotgalibacillus proteolyticus]|uniref:Spo0A-P phosphatase n=1 Tax=Jeotgalibacillus proteolyticus TaxID=2082395 RepID=A0A2S5GG36_9BACL|nr:aspartyl-phosphate phosphatase Spo0E family protein [Jeotgalibacillus proteolyticus]PPA71959.1 Spo0A-P phosphatase [Jeotgalibacillus proteolyticus]
MADQYRLLKQIEEKRQMLIYVVSREGLTSSSAIQYSQELDDLLNRYDRLYSNCSPSSPLAQA